MNTTFKVKQVEDNKLFESELIENKIKPSMVISGTHPLVSITFLRDKMESPNIEVLKELAIKANLNYEDIKESNLTSNVANDLYVTSEKALQKSDESGIVVANLAKSVMVNKVMPHLTPQEATQTLSVDELMKKLYPDEESKGRKK